MGKVTTQSNTYEYEELEKIENIVKQGFKDYWNEKIDTNKLEEIKKNSGLSFAEIQNCQYDASMEDRKEKEYEYELLKKFCLKNGEYNKYYYPFSYLFDEAVSRSYVDSLEGRNTIHSNKWSLVYDFCKENNIKEDISVLTSLLGRDINKDMLPKHVLWNYEISHNLSHYQDLDNNEGAEMEWN